MSIPKEIAEQLNEAYNRFDPKKPIAPSNPFYVDCDQVRGEQGEKVAKRMATELSIMRDEYAHFLFTGHVGSGKSSELLKVKELLERDYNFSVVYFDAYEELDLYNVHHTDLLLAIAYHLFNEKGIEISRETLQNIQDWFKEVIKTILESEKIGAEVGAGVEAGGGFPWLGKLFANFKANISKNKEQRSEIRERYKQKAIDLLDKVNRMLDSAEHDVKKRGKNGLVLIIDNLEKMSSTLLKEEKDQKADVSLFVDYGNLLLGLNCHLICTVPIRLLHLPIGRKLHEDFSKVFILPVIKIKEKETEKPYEKGIKKFSEIYQNRMHHLEDLKGLSFFGNDGKLLEKVIQFSGGNVKTFIRIMRLIIFNCKVEEEFPVNEHLIDKVFRQEIRDYDRMISDDRIKRLIQVAYTKHIDVGEDSRDSEMLQLGWILVYSNGGEWCDVEPVIRSLERFRELWDETIPENNKSVMP